jgi:general stress protein YciG
MVNNERFYTIYNIPGVKMDLTKISLKKRIGKSDNQKHLHRAGLPEDDVEVLQTLPLSVGDEFAGVMEVIWRARKQLPWDGAFYTNNWNSRITPEKCSEAGRIGGRMTGGRGGRTQLDAGTHNFQLLTPEQRTEIGRLGGKACSRKQLQAGTHNFQLLTPEQRMKRRESVRKGTRDMTPEARSERVRKSWVTRRARKGIENPKEKIPVTD